MAGKPNPFTELERLFEQMQENFERAARRWDPGSFDADRPGTTRARMDLEDRGDELVLTVDLPGFTREDIAVRISDHTLRLEAEREETTEEQEGEYIRRERRHSSVDRSVKLPDAVEADAIDATYTNGVLTVRMPKQDPIEDGTEIEIN